MEQINNFQAVKMHLKTQDSTKNLTWKESKQKASLAIYNYINDELKKYGRVEGDTLNRLNQKEVEIKKIKKTLEYVLDKLQKRFNSGNYNSLRPFLQLEEEIKDQLNEEIYNNLTGNSLNKNEKLSKKLLKNLKIIVTHKNTDGIWSNSNTKTSFFSSGIIRTSTHEKIRQAINKNIEYAKLSVIEGVIDTISDENYGYSGKTSTYYYKPHEYSIFNKSYEDKDGFGILKLDRDFNYAIIKAKWKNGIPVSGQIKSHDYDKGTVQNNIEFNRNEDKSYTFTRKVKNLNGTTSEYTFTTKTFKEKLNIITGTLESLDKLPKDMALENKQIILEKSCHGINTVGFLKEFNDDLISSELTTNNYISILKTPRGYDKDATASASLAVVYHLIKVSKALDDNIIDKDNNKVNLDKLRCYINLFMNLPKNVVDQIIKYAKTIRMDMRANQESINLKGYKLLLNPNLYNNEIDFKELTEILLKNKNTHALMHANEKQKELYNNVINKLKSAVDNFGNEGAADKSLSNLLENTIGAHKKNKTQKAKKHDTYNRVKEVLKERIENLIAEKLFSEMGVLPNGNKLILFNKSLPSAFNKLSAEEKAKLIDELKEYYRNNNALEGMLYWPINTYQLKNSNDEVLQTMTGSFIDKDSEANNLRFRFFLDLIGVTDNEDKRIYFSRLLDTNSEKTKIKKDQETLGLEAKQKRLNLIVRQAHFSEGFWNDKKGSGFNIIEGQDNKNDYTKSISDDLINVYNLIDAKFPLNRENKDNNYYANIGLKNISCEFFELMHNKNLTASQLILLNTLQIILKNKLPKFNVVSIVGCKSAKDRTMVEIVTECALQATIEDAFFNNEETRGLEKPIDLELLVKNNKINANDLTPQLQKTFIDNFDDSILYIANLHDNKLHTNQNARTHFKVLNDFAYHRKFKEPYKEIKAGS